MRNRERTILKATLAIALAMAVLSVPAVAEEVLFAADFENGKAPRQAKIAEPGNNSAKAAMRKVSGTYVMIEARCAVKAEEGIRIEADCKVDMIGGAAPISLRFHVYGDNGKIVIKNLKPSKEWKTYTVDPFAMRPAGHSKVKEKLQPGETIHKIAIMSRHKDKTTEQALYVDNVRIVK